MNKQTDAFLHALCSSLRIPRDGLIVYESGSIKQRATWGHPQVAINIAQWISPEIGLRVLEWLSHTGNRSQTTQIKLVSDTTFKLRLQDDTTLDIGIRPDGFINATQLCKAGGKLFGHYKDLKQTQDYLQALSSNIGIPIIGLMESKSGHYGGTYVHRKVAYHLAQWISPQFAVQVSNVLDELMITGRVELGNEKSNAEIEATLKKQLEDATNRLERYEPSVFGTTIDLCPVEYYRKDIVYFLKFKIPDRLHEKYLPTHPDITNENFACIEFGVTSDLEQRLTAHKNDKKKDSVVFIHAFELDKRYDAAKIEHYVKTIAKQLGIRFKYERNKETIMVDKETFNILLARVKEGICRLDVNTPEAIENDATETCVSHVDTGLELRRLELNHELELGKLKLEESKMSFKLEEKKLQFSQAMDLFNNQRITFDQYNQMVKV
jgi:predicted GIY-YIG superfamily endonuclease